MVPFKFVQNLLFHLYHPNVVYWSISRNWPKCNKSNCNYMGLLIIATISCVDHILMTTLQLICNYFGFHPSMWTTFNLVFIQEKLMLISYNCDHFSHSLMNIQRCILCILRGIVIYIKIYKCIFWIYMNNHITNLSN